MYNILWLVYETKIILCNGEQFVVHNFAKDYYDVNKHTKGCYFAMGNKTHNALRGILYCPFTTGDYACLIGISWAKQAIKNKMVYLLPCSTYPKAYFQFHSSWV